MPGSEWFHETSDYCCAEETFIHASSYVDPPCQLGHGTQIMHFCHVMANSVIGNHCQIGHNVTIASGVFIGDNVRVMNNAMLNTGVILEDEVYCGPSTVFSPLKHVRGEAQPISRIHPTLVKRGSNIGANTTIASGFTIGQHTFVESGSVIDRNIPDFAVVYGNPVQFAGWRCECGAPLRFEKHDEITCSRCAKRFARQSETEVVLLSTGAGMHDSHLQSSSTVRPTQRVHRPGAH